MDINNPFESVTKAAIEDILRERMHRTRHGYVLSERGYQDVIIQVYGLIKTSRELKEKGDRLIGGVGRSPGSRNLRGG